MKLSEAAGLLDAEVLGDGAIEFQRVSPIHDAGPDDLAFLGDRRYAFHLPDCRARALLVSSELAEAEGGPADRVVVSNPQEALRTLLEALHPPEKPDEGVSEGAFVDPTATLGESVSVAHGAVIGPAADLGPGVVIGPNSVVGEGVRIGAGSRIYPNVTLYPGVVLGERVIIHAGTRIGVDGFGYVLREGRHEKIPQVGGCEIGDDVEIGANCTIDRGSIGRTRIGSGCKIDNLVHIAHNVQIGPGSVLVAQVGIAGSTEVGTGVVFGGQAGITGHVKIGAGARIGAQAGVIGDVAPGETVSGYPARNHREYLRAMAALMKLPEILKGLRGPR